MSEKEVGGARSRAELRAALLAADRAHVMHPYAPVDDQERRAPLVIARAKGAWLEDLDGRRYLDGNSSWYVAALGHGHPRLVAALERQARELAHVSLAGVTHEASVRLAEELLAFAPPGLSRVFYTDNGSTAIEVAMRAAIQAWQRWGKPEKTRFLALDGAFHGDTLGASSLGGVEIFRRPFAGLLLDCVHAPVPEPGESDDGHARAFAAMTDLVEREAKTLAAVVVEPVVQATAGMRIYDPRLLIELRRACDAHDVLLIIDEVFTGYGRTGARWGADHAGVRPDIMCVGKAFSAILPMGAALFSQRVADAFRGDREHALLYGHTFCGNPLGAAVAREVLAIHRDEKIESRAARKGAIVAEAFGRIAKIPGVLRVRSLGMVGAADLAPEGGEARGYLGERGWRVYDEALARGAYLRPLGDTVYVTPPLIIPDDELRRLLGVLEASVARVLGA